MANKEFSHEQANRLVPTALHTSLTLILPILNALFPLLPLAKLLLISQLVKLFFKIWFV